MMVKILEELEFIFAKAVNFLKILAVSHSIKESIDSSCSLRY